MLSCVLHSSDGGSLFGLLFIIFLLYLQYRFLKFLFSSFWIFLGVSLLCLLLIGSTMFALCGCDGNWLQWYGERTGSPAGRARGGSDECRLQLSLPTRALQLALHDRDSHVPRDIDVHVCVLFLCSCPDPSIHDVDHVAGHTRSSKTQTCTSCAATCAEYAAADDIDETTRDQLSDPRGRQLQLARQRAKV